MASNFVRTGGLLADDAIQVVIGGTSYQGWTEIDVDSDIMNPADNFIVSGTIPKAKPTAAEVRAGAPSNGYDDFREGKFCDVYVGLDRQMAGVIDDVRFSGDRSSARIKISGRDKGAFLVDGEAKHLKATKYTVKTFFEALIDSSWGIKNVIFSNEANRQVLFGKKDKKKPKAKTPTGLQSSPRASTKVDPGQRIAAIMDLHCRRLGITWWLTASGDLFIGKPNYDQEAAYHFDVPASSANGSSDHNYLVESWEVGYAMGDRFSEMKLSGQGIPDPPKVWDNAADAAVEAAAAAAAQALGAASSAGSAASPLAANSEPPKRVASPKFTAIARDPDLVERGIVRKHIIADSDVHTQDEAQERVDWEMGRARLKGLTINLKVPGFRQGDRLYAVDTIATVAIEEAGIDGKFYVTQRRFTENRGNRRTQLTLVQPGVWLP